jgi:RHS repeat-associated protein
MAGISSKVLNQAVENKTKFNGIAHVTEFDLNTYDAFYRNLDPQIGRWWGIDPKPILSISPCAAMINNPILLSDKLGDTTIYYNMDGQMLGTINNAGAISRVKISGSLYADAAVQYKDADWSSQSTANDFVTSLTSNANYLESVGDGNVISFETGKKSLVFDGGNLNVNSHFDDGSTITVNTYSASSGIKKADGSYNYDPLPNGSYNVNNGRYRGKNEGKGGFYRDGIAFTFDVNPNFTTVNGQPMRRTELRIHPDGNRPGSAGRVALACDQSTLQGFYNDMKTYIINHGSISLAVADPANPNVSYNSHANDKKKSGE